MERVKTYLQETAGSCGIVVTDEQAESFQFYLEELLDWNGRINLTAITEPKEVAVKHFLDSLILLRYLDGKENASLIDVGTGAGFPGVPLKIMRPDLRLTLLDSQKKRLAFIRSLLIKLGQDAEMVHARAEEGGRREEMRGCFSFATARAVAPLNLLCEYCLPYLEQDGLFLAMKGPGAEEEAGAATAAVKQLGCEIEGLDRFTLPGGDARGIVRIRRVKPLPEKYPRPTAKIKKSPL